MVLKCVTNSVIRNNLYLIPLFLFFYCNGILAQNSVGEVFGVVKDENGKPLEGVAVVVTGQTKGAVSDARGKYELEIASDSAIEIYFSYLGYAIKKETIEVASGKRERLTVLLSPQSIDIGEVEVEDKRVRDKVSTHQIDVKDINVMPNASGNIEGILKTLPGVTSNNELSSQYSVRGGNFDENLVYVNDFEIYRPFLIRSGQQEGLSFVNPDLVGNIEFSSGGYEAKYGDKMSSVLDIKYKRPDALAGSVSASLLGANMHLEGTNDNYKLRYLFGLRYKSNQYLLNGLDQQGDYRPSFADVQALIGYDFSDKWEVEWIGNYSQNRFQFIPETRATEFGVVNNVLRLTVFFDGQEINQYTTAMTGLSTTFKPSENLRLKWLASVYVADERETFDVIGEYWLDAIESNLGNEDFGQVKYNLGVGTFHDNGRNFLNVLVPNFAHKGYLSKDKHFVQWGARFQYELIDDRLKEWQRLDSAGYSLPYSNQEVLVREYNRSKVDLSSRRYTGYIQDSWSLTDSNEMTLTGGLRYQYWDLNKESLLSPRLQFAFKPRWKRDVVYKLAYGIYYQAPFYRELRDLQGNINTTVKAQKAIHYVAGMDYNFKAWGRPFKFITELYYKQLSNLNPYEIENVRIRYFSDNVASGYATGVDFRLYGEFVKNADSWFSLSFLKTQEDIANDFFYEYYNAAGIKITPSVQDQNPADSIKVEPGLINRPTDQRVNFSIFFQDYFPKNENFKMHLNLVFGTGLPFGPADGKKYNDRLRVPPYRRVDIGFSALLWDKAKRIEQNKTPLKYFNTIWFSLEVFNLLDVNNTVSYIWIKDVTNTQYAVPNFLTSRRLNARLVLKF